jgi:hypothetical protein
VIGADIRAAQRNLSGGHANCASSRVDLNRRLRPLRYREVTGGAEK